MRVMMAFQKYPPHLLSIFFFTFLQNFLFSFTSADDSVICASIWFCLHSSRNVLAFCTFFNQRITRDSFRPSFDILNGWQTILATLHPLHPPHPRLSNQLRQNQRLNPCHILHFYGLTSQIHVALYSQGVFWSILQSALTYNKCTDGGDFSWPILKSPCIKRNRNSSLWAGDTRVTDTALMNKHWRLWKHPTFLRFISKTFQKPFKKIGKCIHCR